MMGWYGGGMGAGMWLFMGLFWIALIALIIWLVIRLLPSHAEPGTTTTSVQPTASAMQESPMDILDRRLAQGEIDLDTYQAHRAALISARGAQR
ncbi:SHOCT domain-containing protein [Pengzhenrongella phosphoraccumulans]|uniref:SHOCT domain-containing protein n=1 Tax=Pengzhenrongella phosphoraccumulans TaxID=3114394 RepID=UPI0038904764